MKQITIIGNIGSQAIRRTTSDGRELMSFSVAVSRTDSDATWFNCVGLLRNNLIDYLVKGQGICVVGDLSASVYQNRPDLTVNIDRIELIGRRPEENTAPVESAPEPTPAANEPSQENYTF